MSRLQRTLVMTVLCLSGGTIYNLPYIWEVFYIPTQQAFGLSKTQLGVLLSVFGGISMITYFLGGWLADRVSPRKLISSAMLVTGVIGLYYATFPGFKMLLIIHVIWALSISLVFWNAMIKATRDWAPSEEQGRAFGFLEGGRGVVEVIPTTVLLALFAWLGSDDAAFSTVIICFSVINILVGIAAWLILKEPDDDNHAEAEETKRTVGWEELRIVLKMPVVWLTALVIMGANTAYWGTYTFTTYASEIFLMTVVMAGVLSVGRMWVKPFAAVVSGYVADRIGISRAVAFCMLLTTISFALFTITPANPAVLPFVIVNVGLAALGIFAVRGIYFALLDEGGVPIAMTGTAAGVASGIGFLPEFYMPLFNGIVLDTYPGLTGYRILFGFVTATVVIGFLAALLMIRMNRKAKI